MELAKKEAKKYKSIGEAQKKNTSLAHWVSLNNLRDEVFSHCFLRIQWTEDRIMEEALKHNKKVDFQNAPNAAYKAAKRLGILDKVCSHMEQNTRWTEKMLKDFIKENKIKHSFDLRKLSSSAYKASDKFGIKLQSGRR